MSENEQGNKETRERIVEIEIERLREFQDHPFKVQDDEDMAELKESISKYGILSPVIVRPMYDGTYEIISGHRRCYAAKSLGFTEVPVIIRAMNNIDATIFMVDSNLHRSNLRPSEKAYAYRMKYEAMLEDRRQMNIVEKEKLMGRPTIEIMGDDLEDSPKQIQRYIRLTRLSDKMMDRLDRNKLGFRPACEIAFLNQMDQEILLAAMEITQSTPTLSQAQQLHKLSKSDGFTQTAVMGILSEVKNKESDRVYFKTKVIRKYFPRNYSLEEIKTKILELLLVWQSVQNKKIQTGGNENV